MATIYYRESTEIEKGSVWESPKCELPWSAPHGIRMHYFPSVNM